MKFHQLPPGARFEYRGIIYRKLDMLKASPEGDGKTSLIPRSAEVKTVAEQGQSSPHDKPASSMDASQALAELHRHCQHRLEELANGADPGQIAALKEELAAHYQQLTEAVR